VNSNPGPGDGFLLVQGKRLKPYKHLKKPPWPSRAVKEGKREIPKTSGKNKSADPETQKRLGLLKKPIINRGGGLWTNPEKEKTLKKNWTTRKSKGHRKSGVRCHSKTTRGGVRPLVKTSKYWK